MTQWEVVIGLEIHAQVTTQSKLFCSCSTQFGSTPNTQVCPVCTGMPGALPVLNRTVLDKAITLGLATHCTINEHNEFARKNYFYPDLPKGYQISQLDKPICSLGYLDVEVDGSTRRIGLTRIHMEEDAGKLVHQGSDNIKGATHSLVDLNRSSVPLVEIVSEPDIRSAKEAKAYMESMAQIVRWLGVCDGNLEEGSLRCDANISLRPKGTETLGTKTEVKNLNSFKSVERAILLEIERQTDILDEGGTIIQETRHYNEATNSTKSLRSKEEAHDYRYFPDPDLVPIAIDRAWVSRIEQTLPELPTARHKRYQTELGLSDYDAGKMTVDRETGDFFEATLSLGSSAKEIANWLNGDISAWLKEHSSTLAICKLTPAHLAEMLKELINGTISGKIAKQLVDDMLETGTHPSTLIKEKGLAQVNDTGAINQMIDIVLSENPKAVEDLKAGKVQTMGFIVGQVMRKSQGKANPDQVNKRLKELFSLS